LRSTDLVATIAWLIELSDKMDDGRMMMHHSHLEVSINNKAVNRGDEGA